MKRYYVNTKNYDHEVHHEDCTYLPLAANRKYLGVFSNCAAAVIEAKKTYSNADGCYYCSNECHTS
ncbi:MAG: hypothetical protein QM503_00015 [Bacteroidota bacterium]